MVVDAADDADLQVVVVALLRAEAAGKTFVYRTGPSFVRARSGQQATPAIDASRLTAIVAAAPHRRGESRPDTEHGLIAVGSHVGLTTRQLDSLRADGHDHRARARRADPAEDRGRATDHVSEVAARAAELLRDERRRTATW